MSDVALVVEGSYPYVTGGVSEWTHRLIGGLPDVSFTVVNLGGSGDARYDLPPNVVDLVRVDSKDELPDARVYHALSTGDAGIAAADAARSRGARFVLSEHGIAWLEARLGITGCKGPHGPHGPHGRSVAPAIVKAQARRAYAEADAITAVCDWGARMQNALGARGSRVVQNAVDLTQPRPRRRSDRPLVGFVGRVVQVKDVLGFLAACRLVADELPAARFVVVGPLDHDEAYVERCRERAVELSIDVTYAGTTDPRPWYELLDVLVLTSRSEAQPLVALEAMAAGVPVVATAVGGCPELLEGRGLLTQPFDPRGTADAVVRFLGDDELRDQMTFHARRRIEAEHRPETMLAAFASLYEVGA